VRRAPLLGGVALVVVLALLPFSALTIPGVLPGMFASPGTLQLLAICLVFAALALSYDLLFGFTGLLSFGHALYFAVGVYVTTIALSVWHWAPVPAVLVAVASGLLLAALAGAVSLRVRGIAFAMVTLAFAQAGSVLVVQDPLRVTGGEQGLGLDVSRLPDAFVGVLNTRNVYWLALALAVVVYVVVRLATTSAAGHMWAAIRENEPRISVLGVRTYTFKLLAFVTASTLATLCGVVYVLLVGGATADVTTPEFTLALLVMVVLGGSGVRWGAMLGGFAYTLLDQRLGALAGSDQVAALPSVIRVPLSQPLFLLGVLFVLVVLFVPGGLASLVRPGRRTRLSVSAFRARRRVKA
jgi:branched-chain amino acid transport system permease protein